MLNADPSKVSMRAKKRGLPQLGTLGAGNHYAEIQVVDEIFDTWAAGRMGIEMKGQICVMIHSGSRGFGHQVATGILCLYCRPTYYIGSWDSVVDTATRYRLDSPGIESWWGQDFLHLSRPALRPTQPPVQWVPCLSQG